MKHRELSCRCIAAGVCLGLLFSPGPVQGTDGNSGGTTTTHPVGPIFCTGGGQLCNAIATVPVRTLAGASVPNDGLGFFALVRYNPDGTLDPSFGSGGRVRTDISGGNDRARSMALQPDGKIIVAGTVVPIGGKGDFGLARYDPNGTLDTTFGRGGMMMTDFSGQFDVNYAVAVQPDGQIIAAGWGALQFSLARYQGQ
jgi:uncharacterized delta-60 repeat protein